MKGVSSRQGVLVLDMCVNAYDKLTNRKLKLNTADFELIMNKTINIILLLNVILVDNQLNNN